MLRVRVDVRRLLAAPLACALIALLAAGASSAQAAPCRQDVFGADGYLFDTFASASEYGVLIEGGTHGPTETPPGAVKTGDAWDFWGGAFVFAPGADLEKPTDGDIYTGGEEACNLGLGGQEVAFPVVPLHGLEVQHRWYVDPGPLRGARVVNVLHNPGPAPVSVTLVQGNPVIPSQGVAALGSGSETSVFATSDGTGSFSPAARWGVTNDTGGIRATDGDPALAHVWDGPSGQSHASAVVLSPPGLPGLLYWDWQVTVPPGGTSSLISYEIQAVDPSRDAQTEGAQAVAQAQAREKQSPASLYIGMSPAEIAGTLNWPHPIPTAAIAPVGAANSAAPLQLSGSGSVGTAAGLPQCASLSYAWKADDGATGSGPTFSHLFTAGSHRATLTVTNACGGSQSTETSFTVDNGLKLGRARLNRGIGTAALKVTALGPGKLTLSGAGVERQSKTLKQAGTVSLIVRPVGKALRALQRTRKAKVKVTVSLTPTGGVPSTLSKTIVLKRVR